jgi:hypothetical protein
MTAPQLNSEQGTAAVTAAGRTLTWPRPVARRPHRPPCSSCASSLQVPCLAQHICHDSPSHLLQGVTHQAHQQPPTLHPQHRRHARQMMCQQIASGYTDPTCWFLDAEIGNALGFVRLARLAGLRAAAAGSQLAPRPPSDASVPSTSHSRGATASDRSRGFATGRSAPGHKVCAGSSVTSLSVIGASVVSDGKVLPASNCCDVGAGWVGHAAISGRGFADETGHPEGATATAAAAGGCSRKRWPPWCRRRCG